MVSLTSAKTDQEEKMAFLKKEQTNISNTNRSNDTQTDKSTKSASTVSRKRSTTTTTARRKGPRGPKMSDGTEFDTGPYGWIFSFIYLFILWGLSIAFAVALTYYNYSRLDEKYPTYFGGGSFLGDIPKVTFDPNPKHFDETNLRNVMEFNKYTWESYLDLLIRYKHVAQRYNDSEAIPLCRHANLTNDLGCRFDRKTGFGDCHLTEDNLENGFGFSEGMPCLMLKLNKIIGWYPNFLNKTTCPPDNLCCGPGINFRCTSNANVAFEQLPKTGIPACYFPYANQPKYEQPYVMMKMTNITAGKEIQISCYVDHDEIRDMSAGKRNEIKFVLKMSNEPEATPRPKTV